MYIGANDDGSYVKIITAEMKVSIGIGKFVECGRLKRMSTRCVLTNKFESDR